MITYEPFWKTLKCTGQSTYTLINHHSISSSTINRLRKNRPINTNTLEDLCKILHCNINDLVSYIPDEEAF